MTDIVDEPRGKDVPERMRAVMAEVGPWSTLGMTALRIAEIWRLARKLTAEWS